MKKSSFGLAVVVLLLVATVAVRATAQTVESGTIPGPCDSTQVQKDMTVADAEQVLTELRVCDPTGEYFDLAGRIREDGVHFDFGDAGANAFANIYAAVGTLRPFFWVFERLPVLRRREIMESVGPKAAVFTVEYLHPEQLEEWLLGLDWEQDIAPVNPDWYFGTTWPTDRYERVEIDGYGSISKIELWVRMFWRRRGEAMFEITKNLVSEAVAAKSGG